MKIHSGEKVHKCIKCDLASVQADSLRKHMRTHSKCDIASTSEDFLKKYLETQIAWRYTGRKVTLFYFEALTLEVGCEASDDYDKS